PDRVAADVQGRDREDHETGELPPLRLRAQRKREQRDGEDDEEHVERVVERERCPQTKAARRRLAVEDAPVVVAGASECGSEEQRAPRRNEHAERSPELPLPPLEQEIRRRDEQAREDRSMQVRPERDE